MRKKIVTTLLLVLLLASTFAMVPVKAVSEDEIEESIVEGLAWLASIQNLDGSWSDYEYVAHTGLAVLKFIDRAVETGYDPFSEEYMYSLQVINGLNYIFSMAQTIPISVQTAGDPDSDGDGIGVHISDSYHLSYATGISLMAISSAKPYAPGPVSTGPLTGWSYLDVIVDAVDYLAYGQNEDGWSRGGWGYDDNQQWSDNSNSGWVTLGLGYAEAAGTSAPSFVKDELNIWIDYIQNDVNGDPEDGGSGYTSSNDWVNVLKTGNLLYQMRLYGDSETDQRVINAIDYLEKHWNDANLDPGWKGTTIPHYQSAFCIMKGLESFSITSIDVGGPGYDWFDDIATHIVNTQNADGSWPWDYWGDDVLATTWALLTLQRTVAIPQISVSVDIKPGSWPNPINKGSKGVISVAICGTEDFDVMTIDPGTVQMFIEGVEAGVSLLRWSYEDAATPYLDETPEEPDGHEETADGYVDLVLKFDAQEVVGTLGLCEIEDWIFVKLFIRGNLFEEEGGTPFEGFDWVRIQSPRGKAK